MTSSFGARLRQQREERGIPLSVIAGQTKIKISLLEGLERDDLAHWPPGIFRRAYLRSYANAIGLNADTVVSEFLAVYPETPEVIDAGAVQSENGGAPTRLRYLFGSAVGSLARLRRGPSGDDRPQPQGTTGSTLSLSFNAPPPPEASVLTPPAPEPAFTSAPDPVPEPDPFPAGGPANDDPIALAPSPDRDVHPVTPPETEPDAPAHTVDLLAAAYLCTALGRVESASQMPPLLRQAAVILGARGLIVWVWDSIAEELQPSLVYGYPDKLVAQLPRLKADDDNLTAAAFRSSETLAISGNAHASAALAVPLQAPGGSAGVLAVELPPGSEEADPVRAIAMVFAAMLAQLVGGPPSAHALPADADRSAMSPAV
jgi:hypothetical protein